MLPASVFNELRRSAIAELDKIRIANNKPKYTFSNININTAERFNPKQKKIRIELHKASQLENLDQSDLEQIILPIHEVYENADDLLQIKEILAIAPPRFMAGNEKELIIKLKKLKEKAFLICIAAIWLTSRLARI